MGKLPLPKVYPGICDNCGTEVEVVLGETFLDTAKDGTVCNVINCPLKSCNHKIVIKEIT